MRQFVRYRRAGERKEIADQPERSDRFEWLRGEARALRGEANQEKCRQAYERKREIKIHGAEGAPALLQRCIVIAAHLVGKRSQD